MGTCDELALDVLINSFMGFSRDLAGLKRIVVGGANRDWPVTDLPEDEESEGQFDIDPMQLPEGMDEELELLDDLEVSGGGQSQSNAICASAMQNEVRALSRACMGALTVLVRMPALLFLVQQKVYLEKR
ncbi:hypothetical protein DUNSADRAFT_10285 [Dunaliella salina]|uniref:Encoded protein n=1 Tax=Dunaliella salina TaxID=3046 RepID=A0ABQ7GFQ2_DUNSA|nr:hypothetical protein DUNSADRAFT_10285 [Dunaliella salina]|eukprot:KAF5833416.1 hypothetical protein DUNSADRAFT_10285 [Dunaliella salina]